MSQHATQNDSRKAGRKRQEDVHARHAVRSVVDQVHGFKPEGRQRGEAAEQANGGEVFPNGGTGLMKNVETGKGYNGFPVAKRCANAIPVR